MIKYRTPVDKCSSIQSLSIDDRKRNIEIIRVPLSKQYSQEVLKEREYLQT